MAHNQDQPDNVSYSNPIDISDYDEIHSPSDDDLAQKERNNHQIAQAVKYLQQEGGKDSPTTFMDRVNRIDETLVNQLPHQGLMFDPKLHRRVRTLVNSFKRDFENAAREDEDDSESHDNLAQFDSPMALGEEALYRADSPSPLPTLASTQRKAKIPAPRRPGAEDKVKRERRFKYGGDSEIENWHKDYPASLPFPDTHMMAHWESLKIDYDLNRPKDAASVEAIVPLEVPEIAQYFELPLYESGSRFKLATVSNEDQIAINKVGTNIHLEKVVNKFYGMDETDANKRYREPRLFLQQFNVGHQWAPELLRSALNTSPTKSRTPKKSAALEKLASSSRDGTAKHRTVSPAFRRISQVVRRAASEGATISPAPARKPHSRSSKNLEPDAISRSANSITLKRKPSLGSQPYESPEFKIKKVLRDTKKRKSVGFVEVPTAFEEDSDDPNYPASPVYRPQRGNGRNTSKASKAGQLHKAMVENTGGRISVVK